MTTKICASCGAEKPLSDFANHGGRSKDGKRSKCMGCEAKSPAAGGGAKAKVVPPAAPTGSLEVAAGLGFRASIEDGLLCIEQDRQEDDTIYTHSLTLSPHEARQLIEWVERQVAQ